MDADDRVALFTQLGVIEEKLDNLNELKPEVKANTKFRWFTTAFIVIVIGLSGFVYKSFNFYAAINKNVVLHSKVVK